MKIAILGPGCPKCRKLYENAQQAVAEAGVEAELEKVEDIQKINDYNVFMTRHWSWMGRSSPPGRLRLRSRSGSGSNQHERTT